MRTWLITGCSSGLGRALALAVSRMGDRLVATARRPETLHYLEDSDRLLKQPLDVTDERSVAAAVQAAEEMFGGIDVLVNNAGIGYYAGVEESEPHQIRRLFDVNVFGTANVTNAVLPGMRRRRGGTIVNISSIGGLKGFVCFGWYNATKFAIEGLSDALSQEVESFGIRVLLVEPSGFETKFQQSDMVPDSKRISDYVGLFGSELADFGPNASKRPGDPDRAASAIIEAVTHSSPPHRLLLGNAAVNQALGKLDDVGRDIRAWEHVSRGADSR